MAEVKNAFIKSKMNKDLDSRLIPSGEYRNAVNAQVSKSEGSDVGALENVLGNALVADFTQVLATAVVADVYASIGISVDTVSETILVGYKVITNNYASAITVISVNNYPGDPKTYLTFSEAVDFSVGQTISFALNSSSIGYLVDESKSDIYIFITDNDGSSYMPSGVGSNHSIYKYNTLSSIKTKLVEGAFLNFSKLSPIYGVNLLEDLLFWTDNRNQPRKINVTSAITPGYYSNEDNISVAKFSPYKPIELYKESLLSPTNYETTLKDVSSKHLPDGGVATVNGTQTGFDFIISDINIPFLPNEPYIGQEVSYVDSSGVIQPIETGATVTGWNSGASTVSISVSTTLDNNVEIVFNKNPYYIPGYSGDPKFLEDKFPRFSYRFKFDDGEYSLIAPFTQVCFIPKQDGYFLNNSSTEGDQQQAFSSTIVDFMENKVNKIDLQIPLPTAVSDLASSLHVKEIDILYKESDGLTIKVIETIPVNSNLTGSSNILQYEYQSQIPYKTLSSKEITRVSDKTPVRALGQEVISNRIVYANYQDKHTPPSFLNYNVSASSKSVFSLETGEATVNGAVIDSTIVSLFGVFGNISPGSYVYGLNIPENTIVVEFNGIDITLNQSVTVDDGITLSFEPSSDDSNSTSIVEYPSSSLKTNRNYQVGFVLSDKFGRQSTVILSSDREAVQVGALEFRGSTIYSPYQDDSINPIEWLGNSLKVSVNDPIGPSQKSTNGTGEPGVYNGDPTSPDYNPLGWYSYKIVVKQTEQEYYNVYTAGAMKGLPFDYKLKDIGSLSQNTSFVTLINDNINKVPRDLSEVGPQDKSFRSSVSLFGRVENISNNINIGNKQYYPGRKPFTTSSIEDLYDLFEVEAFKDGLPEPIQITNQLNAYHGFFKSDSNPFVAEIVTSQNSSNQFGINNSVTTTTGSASVNGAVSNSIEIVCSGATGDIETGSVLSWAGMPVLGDPFVVISTTGGTDPTITLNKKISITDGVVLTFTLELYNNIESLAVFETSPTISRLDIFWETSSAGLVNDLNNLVLNSSNAGSGFSSWNDAAFDESITEGEDILFANFQLQDNFGSNIILQPGDTFNLISVFDQRSPTSLDATSWFELYEAGGVGTGVYNIRTTSLFVPNVYYSATTGANDFNFSFQAFVSGVYSNINQIANLSNVTPVMKGPDNNGSTPDPAIDFTLSGNTVTEDLFTMTAVNGANPLSNLTGEDITWTVTATDSASNPVNHFGVSFTNTPSLSTCIVKNNDIGNVLAQTYTLTLRCIDAGGAFQEVIITANLGVIPSSVTDGTFNWTDNAGNYRTSLYTKITINLTSDPLGWNGVYYIAASWESVSSGVDNITIKLDALCVDAPYIYGSTAAIAQNRYRDCYAPNYDFPFNDTQTNVPNFLDWSYEVI